MRTWHEVGSAMQAWARGWPGLWDAGGCEVEIKRDLSVRTHFLEDRREEADWPRVFP
jgi:hypothetical protein